MIELTPIQIRGLKLAKNGDVFLRDGNKWTHLDATETYARTDRFKERPQKVKFMKTSTLIELTELGLLKRLNPEAQAEESAHAITMAGKMWLLKNK